MGNESPASFQINPAQINPAGRDGNLDYTSEVRRFDASTLNALHKANELAATADKNYTSKRISGIEREQDMHQARKILLTAMQHPANSCQPALHLRYAALLAQSPWAHTSDILQTIETAIVEMNYVLDNDIVCVSFGREKQLLAMYGLARYSAQYERQDLTLGLLDILDKVDPGNITHNHDRKTLRANCQSVIAEGNLAPAKPAMISPSLVPPAIGRPAP